MNIDFYKNQPEWKNFFFKKFFNLLILIDQNRNQKSFFYLSNINFSNKKKHFILQLFHIKKILLDKKKKIQNFIFKQTKFYKKTILLYNIVFF